MPASTPFHLGLTPERIIDAAQQLTRESNLFGWSIRDLARRLQVTPSVIYHHVGGKDLLAKRVAERVIASIHAPDGALEWQEWFRRLLVDAVYPAAVSHPGVAKWLLMHGVPFPSAAGIFEVGIGKLERAGIEPGALIAYSAIMNNATLTISMGDERLLHEEDGPRDHAAMMAEFQRAYTDHPAWPPSATISSPASPRGARPQPACGSSTTATSSRSRSRASRPAPGRPDASAIGNDS